MIGFNVLLPVADPDEHDTHGVLRSGPRRISVHRDVKTYFALFFCCFKAIFTVFWCPLMSIFNHPMRVLTILITSMQ